MMPDQDSNQPEPSQDSASLVKRLAGPSVTKAGLAKDQTEINRIIAEASKGSKFYENEKKKDKELTSRIAKILKQRDEAQRGVDTHLVEKSVDHFLEDLESNRDLSQIIVHVDMDAFYANVELLHNPDLKDKPFGVGSGILTTASYEARKYGVRSGMPGFIAKKLCPDLIFVKINFSRYLEMSNKVMAIFRRYDPNMQAAGCDEGYLNITSYCREHQLTPDECVQQMRAKVQEETKLTVSAGIAPNKMLAKICSDKNKPNGQFHLPFDSSAIKEFMCDLSIRKIPGVGRVNERLLDAIGIKTCGDIYTHRAIVSLMDKQFGLKFLLRTYLGIASNVVEPGRREERKSIGAERTFSPISDRAQIFEKLEEVAAELESDMQRNGWSGRTVTLKYKLDTYQVFTRAKSFDRLMSTKKEDLFSMGKELLVPELPLTIRLIGLRVTKLKDLRASSPAAGGIKRFFQSADTSPRKKVRLQVEHDNDAIALGEAEFDESMPGFHEHDEEDVMGSHMEVDEDIEPDDDPSTDRPKQEGFFIQEAWPDAPHTSTSSTVSKNGNIVQNKRRSSRQPINPDANTTANEPTLTQTCPVCSKILVTDNEGLNAHIDFCLSRTAIMEAQVEASSPSKRTKITGDLRTRFKGKGRS